jgi:hypothetical protein
MRQKLVCISPNEEVGGRIIKQPLTYGRIYEVITSGQSAGGKFYFIENDKGKREHYWQNKFVTPEEYRNQQLDKIL